MGELCRRYQSDFKRLQLYLEAATQNFFGDSLDPDERRCVREYLAAEPTENAESDRCCTRKELYHRYGISERTFYRILKEEKFKLPRGLVSPTNQLKILEILQHRSGDGNWEEK